MKLNPFYWRRILAYFLQGLLYIVPIAITLYVIYKVLNFIDGIIPVKFPGLGLLLVLVIITVAGYLGTSIIATPIKAYFRRALNRAPLLKTIYTAIKDLLDAFVGNKKTFNQPVLVNMTKESDLQKIGFITNSDLAMLGIEKSKVAVYLPHSYAWSGNLFVVPQENVTPINAKSADIMKFVVSGGVAEISDEEENNS